MEDLNNKATNDQLSASEWNGTRSEVQNIIENAGLTLSAGDQNQLGKAIADYLGNADFYTDSGTANAHVLNSVSSNQSPTALKDGMRVRYRVNVTNTGATTVAVAGLTTKAVTIDNVALIGGELVAGQSVTLEYHNSNGKFNIVSNELLKEVVGFTRSSGEFISDDGVEATTFDIETVIGASFEDIGPTSASATNTWTALDALPLNTTAVLVRIHSIFSGDLITTRYLTTVHARKTGSSLAIATNTMVSKLDFTNRSGSGESDGNVVEVWIPVDDTNSFDLAYAKTSGGITSSSATISLIKFKVE